MKFQFSFCERQRDNLLEKIAKALNVRVSDLLIEEEKEVLEPIYKKDDSGNEIIIGFLKKIEG